ncbi:ribosome maturation factor RimM [Paenibacillus sp. MMS18-CY102]|uniref:ribosome maturation factor RimM n=1 Tax=Paenibacillus sp. MMS18-CY102 TaxID=2682849 RepID=UPI00136613EA|nr:ribosome maturation factor RimM [Paenibacillus sp. MMS18-CY102]MWC26592.1 ribosome maturation factor RimM [Paenibacillus sp. MMS18-CY102]
MADKWFTVGKLVNTHGIRGEVKVWPQTDFPDVRFAPGSKLTLFEEGKSGRLEVEVASSRSQKNVYVLKLKGYDNINDVEKYKGWILKVSEHDLVDLDEDEYYYHEIIGCTVITDEGEELGTVAEILSPGANDVWVVKGKGANGRPKEILIPVIDDVLVAVDVDNKKITVHLIEGLI